MKRRLIIFLLTSLPAWCYPVLAQQDTLKNHVFGGFLLLPLEFPQFDNRALNQELTRLGYPAARYPVANVGIGLQLHANRFITTFSFNKTTRKRNYDLYETAVEYRSTSLNVGYDLTKSYRYSLSPYLGFKGAGLNYQYREKAAAQSFEDYLQTKLDHKEINYSRAYLDMGLGASTQWFYLLNFRVGYLLPLEAPAWRINNVQEELQNGPAARYRFYFTCILGLGGILSDEEVRRR